MILNCIIPGVPKGCSEKAKLIPKKVFLDAIASLDWGYESESVSQCTMCFYWGPDVPLIFFDYFFLILPPTTMGDQC